MHYSDTLSAPHGDGGSNPSHLQKDSLMVEHRDHTGATAFLNADRLEPLLEVAQR